MNRALIIVVAAVASILISCQSPQMQARVRHPQLEVIGSAAKQLSKQDILEIVDVASQNPKMRKPIHRIDADAPDHAEVSGGGYQSASWTVLKSARKMGAGVPTKGSRLNI
jgi:hypothetical protein